MTSVKDRFHPSTSGSPLNFSHNDKAAIIPSQPQLMLIADASLPALVQLKTRTSLPSHLALGQLISSDKKHNSSAQDLLRYFKPNDVANRFSENEQGCLKALHQLVKDGKLAVYHWPYGLPKAAGTNRRMGWSNVNKRPAQKPVTNDDIEKMALAQAKVRAMQEVGRQAAPRLSEKLSPELSDAINDVAVGLANGADTKVLATDAVTTLAGQALNGAVAPAIANTRCAGEPISLVTGEELLKLTDFTLNGPLPLAWWRVYRSSNPEDNGLGHGWSHSLNERLFTDAANPEQLCLQEAEGRIISLPLPAVGERSHNPAEDISICRESEHAFVITPYNSPYGLRRYFERIDSSADDYRLKAIHDSHQAHYILNYHEGQLTDVASSHGEKLHFAYTACGHIGALIHDNGQGQQRTLVTYAYSKEGDLIHACDANGEGERYQYQNHLIRQRQLKSTYCFYFEWDAAGPHARCLRQWGDTIQGQATYDYRFKWKRNDDGGTQVQVTDTRGVEEYFCHNERGKLTEHRDGEGHITTYDYNEQDQLTATAYPDGSCETTEYNEWGQPSRFTDRAGQTTETRYDEQGRISERIVAGEHHWGYSYNDHNQLTRLTNPLGQHTDYTYNVLGLLGTITQAGAQQQRFWWNERGQLTQVQDTAQGTTRYRYNSQGYISEVQQPDGYRAYYDYTPQGQVSAMIDACGHRTVYEYTPLGYLHRVIDAGGTITEYEYDGLSQVSQRTITDTQGQSSQLRYRYDGERNLTGILNEKGEQYQLAYDNNERLIKEVGFDGRTTEYRYNAAGHVIQTLDYGTQPDNPAPLTINDKRNALGQLLRREITTGEQAQSECIHYRWNHQGQLLEATNAHRRLRWEYNSLGQVTAEWQDEHCTRYHYNEQGQCQYTQLPDNSLWEWRFTSGGQLSSLSWAYLLEGQMQRRWVAELRYHDHGQERVRDHGNGLLTLSTQDPSGRLASQGRVKRNTELDPTQVLMEKIFGGASDDYTGQQVAQYRYNATGQLTDIAHSANGHTHYHYDAQNRLTQVEGNAPEYFIHDSAHTVLASAHTLEEAQNKAANTQVQHNRLQRRGEQTFEYDNYGNRSADTDGNRYYYDAQHRLSQLENEQGTTTYRYDALGRRIQKYHQHKDGRSTTTDYLWQGDNLLAETQKDQTGQVCWQQTYVFQPNSHIPMALMCGKEAHDKQLYRYHLDHLGTPEALSDDAGSIVWQQRYSSYGKAFSGGNTAPVQKQVAEVVEESHIELHQPLRFQGQYFDEESQLHYNRHRYYDPETGSFLTQDPIKLAGGINNYRYVPNPITWIDPLGLTNKEDHSGLPQNVGVPEEPDPVKESFFGLNKDENGDWRLRVGPSSWDDAVNANDSFGIKKNSAADTIMCIGKEACSNPDLVSDVGAGDVLTGAIIAGSGAKTYGSIKKIVNPSSRLNISDYKLPNGKITKVATDGKAIVQLDKVERYMRGKSPDVSKELKEMNAFKQRDRKLFDADPENSEILKQLKKENKNHVRSVDMKRNLANAGLSDTPQNNELITKNLLEAGKKASKDNRTVRSVVSGSKSNVKLESTWKILDNGNNYLSTIKVIPAN